MHALLHRALVVAVVLVAATLPALAQGVGLVSGRVTDEQGVPLKGAVVTLSGPAILGSQGATTDGEGKYWFPAVPGNQSLTVTAATPGRVPLMYVGYTARRDGVLNIDFTLRLRGEHEVLVLIQDGVPYHQMALEGALTTMPGHVSTLAVQDLGPDTVRRLRERLDLRPSAVLAVGDLAARLAHRHIRDVPVVYSMVPAPIDSDLIGANLCGVPLNGGFETQLEHLRQVMPEARRVGTVYDPHRMGRYFREAKLASRAAGMELIAAHVRGDSETEMRAALDELSNKGIDAFVLLIDPHTMNASAFEQVAQFAQAHDIVLAVPDASLVVPGKSFSFVPGFWDLGAYAGMLVRRIVEGKIQPAQIGVSYPSREALEPPAARLQALSFRDVLPGGATDLVQVVRDE